ncbi:MAG TPA: class I SAM-dependent RNA methyltransferase [Kineosporiaceae bacterium]|nr:class I SAM-dependent RNA methyltransferase [Kineosporiaceae bacterium]
MPARQGSADTVRLRIAAVAHGGHCVGRHEGRVVFVRHALPGELVDVRLTRAGDADRFWRGDAVGVVEASPDRVDPRCPIARPGGCGGCDWQHASTAAQRRLKADVVREQLARLAGVELPDLAVEAVPGDDDGLGWRTRIRFAVDGSGRAGLRRHRSHDIVTMDGCPIAHAELNALGVPRARWTGAGAVDVVVAPRDGGVERMVVVQPATAGTSPAIPALGAPASLARRGDQGVQRIRGRAWVQEQVRVAGVRRAFRVSAAGFWQVDPGAAQTLLDAVLAATMPAAGERALDLYAGVGLFAAGLAAAVGPHGLVLGVETDARALADARRNLHDLTQVRLVQSRVDDALAGPPAVEPVLAAGMDVVVLDPPRTGAGRVVVERLLALRPRVVAYVACDPAALARDVATAAAGGYRLAGVRAFDLFPMTHHVECVATLVPRS